MMQMNIEPETVKAAVITIAAVNVLAFLMYGADKGAAKNGAWRISEKALLTVAFLGGAAGSLAAMKIFRHKTRKPAFAVGVPLMLALQAVLAAAAVFLMTRASAF
jgi:uncharacterized membrane protein YsdA (DUF1294 family)